jgi:uracil-DNA glycosylase
VKVVILGQDPYHGAGQAHGLCFSVQRGVHPPPSLANIYKEIETDLGIAPPSHGCLEKWTEQGVFLLNAALTVRAGEPMSHSKIGWETFTDAVIATLSQNKKGLVFLLWGNFARNKKILIDTSKHFVLEAAHPSPLSGGRFFGCRHFSQTNELLRQQGLTPVDWTL